MGNYQRIMTGGLGGIAPLLASLIRTDAETLRAHMSQINFIIDIIHVLALFSLGGIVSFLYKEENSPIKLFHIGVAAPALLAVFISSGNIDQSRSNNEDMKKALDALKQKYEDLQHKMDTSTKKSESKTPAMNIKKVSIDIGSLVIPSVYAETTRENEIKTFESTKETMTQQFFRGLFGSTPPQVWFVIVGSYLKREEAEKQAQEITETIPAIKAQVYAPYGNNPYYAVVIGSYTSYDKAEQRRQQAIKAGLRKDSYLWTPG